MIRTPSLRSRRQRVPDRPGHLRERRPRERGQLRSLVVMTGSASTRKIRRRSSSGGTDAERLGKEVGHRGRGISSSAITPEPIPGAARPRHREWSFFFDSDASVMEGTNEDQGGGSSARRAVRRFSRLIKREGPLGAAGCRRSYTSKSHGTRDRRIGASVGVRHRHAPRRHDRGVRQSMARDPSVANPRGPSAASSTRHRGPRNRRPAKVATRRIRTAWEAFFLGATKGVEREYSTTRLPDSQSGRLE